VNTNLPVSVASNVVAVAAGEYHSLFVKTDGTLWAMGRNLNGQLGIGNNTGTNRPVSVAGLTVASLGAMDIAVHSLAVAGMAPTGLTNQAVSLGQPFTFSLNVTNCDGPFTYQWQFNGTNILNATNASYSVASAAFTDAGTYMVKIAGFMGSTSQSASLTVQFIPTIANWPTASTITYGQTLAGSTLSGGLASVPGSFAWTTSTTVPPAGSASPGVTFTPTDSTNYASVSSSVSLLINPRPVVLTGSRLYDGTMNAAAAILTVTNTVTGDTVTVVSGTATLAGALPGAQAITDFGSLVLGGSSATNYTLTGATGSVTITAGEPVKPVITTQPASQVVTLGQSVSLSVTDNNTGSMAYQWFKDGVLLNGQTNSSVSFASFQFTNSGSYRVVMTNTLGLVISVPASLSVSNAPLKAWGANGSGQLGNGTTVNANLPTSVASNVVAVAGGEYHSLFVKADGTLWAMGYNIFGQLGNGIFMYNTNLPVLVTSNVVAVAAGVYHSLFMTADGTLWAMGNNGSGQLGNGTTVNTNLPVSVASNVVAVAAGQSHSLFVKADGTLWAMGYNGDGELGNGTTVSTNLPVSVASNVVVVAAGQWHSLFVKADGTLWAMGQNFYGQLGNGTTNNSKLPVSVASNVVAVAAGADHSLFVKADGTLWAMGYNGDGELGNGTTVSTNRPVSVASNVVAVAAGEWHSLFVKADGTLWATGHNAYGQLGIGNNTDTNLPVSVAGLTVASLGAMDMANHSLAVGMPLPPLITSQPANQMVMSDSNVIFTVTASSFAPLAYQWCFNGTSISGATETNFSLTGVTTNNEGSYTVVVSNAGGSVTSSVATLTVVFAPSITLQPVSQTVINGSNMTLSVTAGGTEPLSYQWYFNDTGINGATETNFSLTDVTTNNTGDYTVVVTNFYGSVTSSVASLMVFTLPPDYNQISSQLLSAGDMRLSFEGIPGWNYALDRSFSLLPTDWVPQATNSAGADGVLMFTNTPDPTTNNFWRIRSVP
jgi:alpha-tubulin suppressor-like RCC1 family protein